MQRNTSSPCSLLIPTWKRAKRLLRNPAGSSQMPLAPSLRSPNELCPLTGRCPGTAWARRSLPGRPARPPHLHLAVDLVLGDLFAGDLFVGDLLPARRGHCSNGGTGLVPTPPPRAPRQTLPQGPHPPPQNTGTLLVPLATPEETPTQILMGKAPRANIPPTKTP